MTLDFSIGISDLFLIAGMLWHYFSHRKQTDENTRRIDALEKRRSEHWGHIESMSATITEWKGTVDKPGLILQLQLKLEEIKTIITGITESKMKKEGQ